MSSGWEPATYNNESTASSGGFTLFVDENALPKTDGFGDDLASDMNEMQLGGDDSGEKPEYTGCKFCKSLQHKARECPEKPEGVGMCSICNEEGHYRKECPNKPPSACKLCKEIGHEMAECTMNRLWMAYKVEQIEPDAAYDMLKKADAERDLDDVKLAALTYAKAYPALTIAELETIFRDENMNTYIIAKEQTLALTLTSVNFQGEPEQKFVATFQLSAKPRRAKQDAGWPADAEENTARLAEAGFVMDSFATICRNCGETGHTSKNCEQDKAEIERVKVECSLCDAEGHRARDCTAPRRKPREPRECRNCGSTEHMAKECDQAPPPRACRNCDSTEHVSKDCDQPKDWSRVTCDNCGEKGHGRGRCKAPKKEEEGNDRSFEDDVAGGGYATTSGDGGDGW